MESGATGLLVDLNEPQRRAVLHGSGPLLVIAGAGSGKTRVITHRLAYLIRSGQAKPGQMMALTFTNKAAAEMRRRVEGLLGRSGLALWVSTFHAACVRILRQEIARMGWSREFVIYDAADQLHLIKACKAELNLPEELYPARLLAEAIGGLKNELISADRYRQESLLPGLPTVLAELYPLYQRRLRENHALDFDDLLMVTVQLFEAQPEVLAAYRRRFHHILIDEYQDTNHAQGYLVRLLAGERRNLCVVGDDDQSIYQWRGARIGNILGFPEQYPGCVVVKLEENYRSTQVILRAASAVVSLNRRRQGKGLWTRREPGAPIVLYCARDGQDEAAYMASTLQRLHREEGLPFSDMALFYRTNAQSRVLEDGLRQAGLPYRIIGGVRFYDRREVKDILAYLRLLVNPKDDLSLRRIINVPQRGIGRDSVKRIEEFAVARGLSLWEGLAALVEVELLAPAVRGRVRRFLALMEELGRQLPSLTASQMVRLVVEHSGYAVELQRQGGMEARERLENLQELIGAAREFEGAMGEEGRGLRAFLDQAALLGEGEGPAQGEERGVPLMTLHTAKGLEFAVVLMAGMEERLFPHQRALDEAKDEGSGLEEERRLCYVGMTRARQRLFLTYARQRRLYGVEQVNAPSRFLAEVPPELVEEDGAGRMEGWPAAPTAWPEGDGLGRSGLAKGRSVLADGADGAGGYAVGCRVLHPMWGTGVVRAAEGTGAELRLTVAFSGVGVKRLMASFAGLRRL